MRIKAIKTFLGKEGKVTKGMELEVASGRGEELIRNGLALQIIAKAKQAPEPKNKMEDGADLNKDDSANQEGEEISQGEGEGGEEPKGETENPLDVTIGGKTGRGRRASSSAQDRQPVKKTSNRSKAKRK